MPGRNRYFVSYRRDDAPGHAGRLYDGLALKYGEDRVFMDVNRVLPGEDFVERLDAALGQSDALIAVIGPGWIDARDRLGRRRLDDGADYVRRELAAALALDVPVIPVLVNGAAIPREAELPETIAALAHRQAVEIRDTDWAAGLGRLVTALTNVDALPRRPAARVESPAATAQAPDCVRLGDSGRVHAIVYAADGSLLAAATDQGAPVWDVQTGRQRQRLRGDRRILGVAFGPDAASLASASDDGTHVWNIASGRECAHSWQSATHSVTFSPDGRLLVSTGAEREGTANVWDMADARYVKSLYATSYRGTVTGAGFSPDGRVIATTESDQVLTLYDAAGLSQLHAIRRTHGFCFSPDGRLLGTATAGYFLDAEPAALVWDVEGRDVVAAFRHRDLVSSLSFSPDGRRVATASAQMGHVWDLESGDEELRLPHRDTVRDIAFSPDGGLLATGGWSDTVNLWNAQSGEPVVRLRHDDEVAMMAFGPDGGTLATATAQDVHIWRGLGGG